MLLAGNRMLPIISIISDEQLRLSCPISINGQFDENVNAGEFHIGMLIIVKYAQWVMF